MTTIHGFSSPLIVPVYERYDATTSYVAISDADRHPRLHYAATIHHGIDIEAFASTPRPASTCSSSGASIPTRAPQRDRVARSRVDGSTSPASSRTRRTSTPRSTALDGTNVRYLGPVAAEDRSAVLGAAHALLHLSTSTSRSDTASWRRWRAGRRSSPTPGSMTELVEDRTTGFLVTNVAQAVDAVSTVAELDRSVIRASAVKRFDVATMVDRYVGVYRDITGDRRPGAVE